MEKFSKAHLWPRYCNPKEATSFIYRGIELSLPDSGADGISSSDIKDFLALVRQINSAIVLKRELTILKRLRCPYVFDKEIEK